MKNKLLVKNKNNTEFLVKVVLEGDTYGRNKCLTHDKSEPLVEFYDYGRSSNRIRNPYWGEDGKLISRYFISYLLSDDFKEDGSHQINLHPNIDEWFIDSEAMKPVIEWLEKTNNDIPKYESVFKH